MMVGHVTPEAYVGGPLSVVREGDMIEIDAPRCRLNLPVTDKEIAARIKLWKLPRPKHSSGLLAQYSSLVSDASHGQS